LDIAIAAGKAAAGLRSGSSSIKDTVKKAMEPSEYESMEASFKNAAIESCNTTNGASSSFQLDEPVELMGASYNTPKV
jgi:hypothetical protein